MKPCSFAIGILALLTACAGAPASPPETPTPQQGDYVLLTMDEQPDVMEAARIEGQLAIANGHCFGLETESITATAVFPVGSRLAKSGTAVEIPGVGVVELGQTVTAGGGYHPPESSPVSIPDECQTSEVILLNPFG